MAGIKIENIHKNFFVDGKKIEVLKGLNLAIEEAKITVILGQSGCGKTTLLRIVGGLESFEGGTVEKDSEHLAFVFQEPRLMPWLSVTKNIVFGVEKQEISSKKTADMIQLMGLQGFEKAFPHQLSGGMQQRVAIARALMFNSRFLLMDEPFAALDYFTRELMQKELVRIQNQNHCGILFVTHSLDEALLIGHKIVIMSEGKIKQEFILSKSNKDRNLLDDEFIKIKKEILKSLDSN